VAGTLRRALSRPSTQHRNLVVSQPRLTDEAVAVGVSLPGRHHAAGGQLGDLSGVTTGVAIRD
jgi:hypothetical protein